MSLVVVSAAEKDLITSPATLKILDKLKGHPALSENSSFTFEDLRVVTCSCVSCQKGLITLPATLKILDKLKGKQPYATRSCRKEALRKSNLADKINAVQKIDCDSGKVLIDLLHAMKNDLTGKWSLLSDCSLESQEIQKARHHFEDFVKDLPTKSQDISSVDTKTYSDKYQAYELALANLKLYNQLHDRFSLADGIETTIETRQAQKRR